MANFLRMIVGLALLEQRWTEVNERMQHQLENAKEWRKVCTDYFRTFAE